MTDTTRLTQLPSAASHAKDIGQITAIEQARAVAEVQARVIVAQNNPRVLAQAIAEMEDACQQKLLADRAFFTMPRGSQEIVGVSIHLAKELARCWRNIDYEIGELRRDDEKGSSEMIAWAWDMQANNKSSTKFIVPHVRDAKVGSRRLTDINQIYELLANHGSRRVREMILKVLPTWFVERAKELCYKTLEDGGGVPLPQRIAAAIKTFGNEQGITLDRLERRLGVKSPSWTPHHLALLTVIRTSLHQGMTTVEEEFPVERITTEALPAAPAEHIGMTRPAEPTKPSEPPPPALSVDQLDALLAALGKVGFDSLEEALPSVRALLGEPGLSNMYAMNPQQVTDLLGQLATIAADANPMAAMDAAVLLAQEQQDGQG